MQNMHESKLKVVLDSSVLITGIFSSTGASSEIIKACVSGIIDNYISTEIIGEVSRNVLKKGSRESAERFLKLINANVFTIVSTPSLPDIIRASKYMVDKDAPILAICFKLPIDYFVTLDQKDFGGLMKESPFHFQVVAPEKVIKQI